MNANDTKKIKVCLLSDTYPPDVGGVARSACRLARGLVRAGHQVHVCVRDRALPPGRVTCTAGADDGPTIHRIGSHKHARDTLTGWSELALQIGRQQDIDLYHGFFLAYAGFLAAYSARLVGVPAVVSARGNDLDRLLFDAARAPFVLEALRLADAVTTVSRALAAKARALAPRAQVHHVPNGVDADLFRPGISTPRVPTTRWQTFPGATLGFVGEARVKKGLAVLLNALAQIAAERPAQLVLVGGVRAKDRPILDLFRRQHPDLSIQVTPYLDPEQLPGVYNALDLVLLPSLRDGLPNALLEAMACARPVVTTPVGGIVDVVQDGVNGFLVPPADADALAQRVLALLDDATQGQQTGHAARETILTAYTPTHELEANLSVYRTLGLTV